jgi:hypothetical protein
MGGKCLIPDDGGVIERALQIAARPKLTQKQLVIDVEAERFRGGIEIGTVNEQREFFFSLRT